MKSNTIFTKRGWITLGIVMAASFVAAQNINYSQYNNAPFFVNPALVAEKSELSLLVIHRSQPLTELQNYNTSSLMLVMPLLNSKQTRRWGGWGFSVMNDEVKGGFNFRTQGISAAYAYNLLVSKNHYISFGMQAGYYQRKVSLNGLSTSTQWVNNVGYVPSMGSGESIADGGKNYIPLSVGLLYYIEDDNQRQIAKVGVAAFNVNQPDVSMTNASDVMPIKVTATGTLALLQGDNTMLLGEGLYYLENYKNTFHIGARARYFFENKNPFDPIRSGSIDFKAGYRVNNAITTELQFHQPNFTVAFAYDFGIASNESTSRPNDVVEVLFSLKKIIGNKKRVKAKKLETYSTIGKVREFYFHDPSAKQTDEVLPGGQEDVNQKVVAIDTATNKGIFKLKHDFKFGFNEAALNEESKAYLDEMVELLQGNDALKLEVIGHTDNVGSHAVNRRVSMNRAQVVVDYLVKKGINPARLLATPMGAREPLMPNTNEANRAANRRVEFVIYNQ